MIGQSFPRLLKLGRRVCDISALSLSVLLLVRRLGAHCLETVPERDLAFVDSLSVFNVALKFVTFLTHDDIVPLRIELHRFRVPPGLKRERCSLGAPR